MLDHSATSHECVIHDLWLDGQGGALDKDAQPDHAKLSRWVHLDYSKPGLVDVLQQLGVREEIRDAMELEETRPRCVTLAGGLLLTLRGVNLSPGAEPDDMVNLRCWTDGRLLLSSRQRELFSIRDARESLLAGRGPSTIGGLIASIVEFLGERITEVMEVIGDDALKLEEGVLGEDDLDVRQPLLTLRRRLIILRRYLVPQREALARLQLDATSLLSPAELLAIRESADRLIRVIEDLDSLRERLSVIHEEYLSRHNEMMNQRMYMLAVFTMIFLPLGFLTGLLGVNLNGIPFAESGFAFSAFLILLVLVVVIQVLILHRQKWF